MTGNAREEITGAMPLYLFPEHWQVAKRNIQGLFGFMCTLDVMGYAASQYYTVPYLVLAKMAKKVKEDPSEVNQRMFKYIQETCVKIIEGS